MILVTGGTGHTGSRLVLTLADRGEQVRVLTREPVRLPLELRRRIQICRGDLTDSGQTREAFNGCGCVIAMTHIKFAPLVIAAAREAGIRRALFTSSTRRFTNFPEETARQVIGGEQAVRESGLDWTILRPSMIYGSHHDNNLVHLHRWLQRFPIHPLVGGGRMKWQPVFTWDVVAAVVAAYDRPATIGREYTLAGPEPVTYEEMVRTFLRVMNRRCLLVPVPMFVARAAVRLLGVVSRNPRVRMDQIDRLAEDKVFDISEARRDLDFSPVSFEEGIRRKVAWKV